MEALGQRIRRARLAQQRSVEDVARELDILEDTYRKVEFDTFEGDPSLVDQIIEFFSIVRPDDSDDHQRHVPGASGPYVGLRAFRSEEAPFFFGRLGTVNEVLKHLDSRRKLVLIGSSGSGKSSLIAAGVGPAWEKRTGTSFSYCRPSPDPIAALSYAVIGLANPELSRVRRVGEARGLADFLDTEDEERGAAAILNVLEAQREPLIAIDQFEELWSTGDESKRGRYLRLITSLLRAGERSGPAFLLGMRTDAIGLFGTNEDFLRRVSDSFLVIPPLTTSDLKEAIEKPATLAGRMVEDKLSDYLVELAGNDPSFLPIVQFTLARLWDSFSHELLSRQDLANLGDISGLLADHIEQELHSYISGDSETLETVLMSLVEPSTYSSASPRRRRASMQEFQSTAEINLIERLISARMVTIDRSEETGETYIDVSHEVILRSWPRLSGWCAKRAHYGEQVDRVISLFSLWLRSDQQEKFLLNDGLCAKLRMSPDFPKLGSGVQQYIAESFEHYEKRTRDHWLGQFEVAVLATGAEFGRVFTSAEQVLAQRDIDSLLRQISDSNQDGIARSRANFILNLLSCETVLEIVVGARDVSVQWLLSLSTFLDAAALRIQQLQVEGIDADVGTGESIKCALIHPEWRWLNWIVVAQELAGELPGLSRIERLQLLDRLRPTWRSIVPHLWLEVPSALSSEVVQALEYMAGADAVILADAVGKFSSDELWRIVKEKRDPSELKNVAVALSDYVDTSPSLTDDETAAKAFVALQAREPQVALKILRLHNADLNSAGLVALSARIGLSEECVHLMLKAADTPEEQALGVMLLGIGVIGVELSLHQLLRLMKPEVMSPELVSTIEWYCRVTRQYDAFSNWLDNRVDKESLSKFCILIKIAGMQYKLIRVPAETVTIGPQSEADQRIYLDEDRCFTTTLSTDFFSFDRLITVATFRTFAEVTGRSPRVKIDHVSPDQSCPIVAITWEEANDFCDWLTAKARAGDFGDRLRSYACCLPTEAMWEHMCRAGKRSAFHFGDDRRHLEHYAWYSANANAITHPSGLKLPNHNGIFDLHGNCWEWCNDFYGKYPETGGGDYAGPAGGETRVLRGGCWNLDAIWCRAATRNAHAPENRNYYTSFRPCFVEYGR